MDQVQCSGCNCCLHCTVSPLGAVWAGRRPFCTDWWAASAEKLTLARHASSARRHTHTHTSKTYLQMCKNKGRLQALRCVCVHTCRHVNRASDTAPAQHSCGSSLMWARPSRQKRSFPRHHMGTKLFVVSAQLLSPVLSLCVHVTACHFESVPVSLPVSLSLRISLLHSFCVTPSELPCLLVCRRLPCQLIVVVILHTLEYCAGNRWGEQQRFNN